MCNAFTSTQGLMQYAFMGRAECCHVGEVYITFAKIFSYNFLYILVGERGNLLFVLISTKSVNMGSSQSLGKSGLWRIVSHISQLPWHEYIFLSIMCLFCYRREWYCHSVTESRLQYYNPPRNVLYEQIIPPHDQQLHRINGGVKRLPLWLRFLYDPVVRLSCFLAEMKPTQFF